MNKDTRIILGLDPGVADTGFGVISQKANSLKLIIAGSIKTSKNKKLPERIQEIYLAINDLIKKYQPDLVAIEKLYFARNVTTALDVGQARGVALLAIKEQKKPILEFTPLQIKQAVTGSGQATKRQVGLMVKTILKLKAVPKPDDAADAAATAICGAFFNQKLAK